MPSHDAVRDERRDRSRSRRANPESIPHLPDFRRSRIAAERRPTGHEGPGLRKAETARAPKEGREASGGQGGEAAGRAGGGGEMAF